MSVCALALAVIYQGSFADAAAAVWGRSSKSSICWFTFCGILYACPFIVCVCALARARSFVRACVFACVCVERWDVLGAPLP